KTDPPESRTLAQGQPVFAVEFSLQTGRILTVATSQAMVWDLESRQPLTPPMTHRGGLTHATISPDGLRVATTGSNGTTRIWTLPAAEPDPLTDVPLQAELLTGGRFDKRGRFLTLDPKSLQAACQTLRSQRPRDFSFPPEGALAWHRQEAADALSH